EPGVADREYVGSRLQRNKRLQERATQSGRPRNGFRALGNRRRSSSFERGLRSWIHGRRDGEQPLRRRRRNLPVPLGWRLLAIPDLRFPGERDRLSRSRSSLVILSQRRQHHVEAISWALRLADMDLRRVRAGSGDRRREFDASPANGIEHATDPDDRSEHIEQRPEDVAGGNGKSLLAGARLAGANGAWRRLLHGTSAF